MSDIGIYQQTILEHSKNPLSFKSLKTCTHQANGNNPLCGDKVEILQILRMILMMKFVFKEQGVQFQLHQLLF